MPEKVRKWSGADKSEECRGWNGAVRYIYNCYTSNDYKHNDYFYNDYIYNDNALPPSLHRLPV